MDEVVSADEGHLLIDLRHDDAGTFGCGLRVVTGDAEGAVALFVGLAHRDESDVYGVDPLLEEAREFMEVTREVVDSLLTEGRATILVEEVKDRLYMPLHLGAQMPRLCEVQHVEDLDVGQSLSVFEEGLRQIAGSSDGVSEDQEVTALHRCLYGAESSRCVAGVVLLPISTHCY